MNNKHNNNKSLIDNSFDLHDIDEECIPIEIEHIDDVDDKNQEIRELEKDLGLLAETMTSFYKLVGIQGDNIKHVEENTVTTDIVVSAGVNELQQAEILNRDNYTNIISVTGGAVIGGLLFGGIGAVFGIAPALIGGGVGTGTGVIVGAITNKIRSLF